MRHELLQIIIACGVLWLPATAKGQVYMTESGTAEFTSSVPLHEFTGTSSNLVGAINLAESTVDFYVDMTTMRTGIRRRDRDMRQALNTEEHPFAEFYGHLVTRFDPEHRGSQPARVRGDFTINGVTRQVEIPGTLQMTDEGLRVEAAWEVNITDHDIVPPRLLFVRVDEVQQVRISAVLTPQP